MKFLINIHEWDACGGTLAGEFKVVAGDNPAGHSTEFLFYLLCAGEPSEHLSEKLD